MRKKYEKQRKETRMIVAFWDYANNHLLYVIDIDILRFKPEKESNNSFSSHSKL